MLRNSLNIQLGKLLFTLIISILIVSCGGGSGNNSQTSAVSIITGVAQKGPFSIDSAVTITALDSNGNAASEPIKTTIEGNSGKFTFEISESSSASFYRMTATGKVFDESNGSVLEDPIKLSSITDNLNEISINVLTHWISQRTDSLVIGGKSFQASLNQSQKELFDIFGIDNPNALDLIDSSSVSKEENAMLLLLSGSLMEVISEYNVDTQTVINEIGNDFLDDGKLSEKGDDWFVRAQAMIKNNPSFHTQKYAKNLRDKFGFNISAAKNLPAVIPLASRPVANIPPELLAEPGETIILDGSSSNDGGDIINFTWFRVDQQTQYDIQVSDRFSAAPFITLPDEATVLAAPNQEISLLYALVVTDVDKLTDTSVVKVTVKIPPQNNNPPVAGSQSLVTDEDTPIAITLSASDVDGDQINFILSTPLATANGIVELDNTLPNVIYTPVVDYFGNDSFTFIVNDGFANSNIATIDIQVNPVNDPPLADAGLDQSIESLESVELDGSNSTDVDGTVDVYFWQQQSGSSVVSLNDTSIVNPTFTAPDVSSISETLSFDLIVTDNDGVDSIADTVDIIVNPLNEPPIANAGIDQNVTSGELVTLSGSGTDSDGTIAGFLWINSNTSITLSNDSIFNPSFTAPVVLSAPETFLFDLIVTDDDGADSVVDTVAITVNPSNQAPVANAGEDQSTVISGGLVTLNGSGTDADGTVEDYTWTHSNGSVTLSNASIFNPTFTAPTVQTGTDTLTFDLVVTDNDGAKSIVDSVVITVNPIGNNRPIANAGFDQNSISIRANFGSGFQETSFPITLDGSLSSDTEDDLNNLPLSYNWTQVSGPVSLDPDNIIMPEFNIIGILNQDIDGDYVFSLVVTDSSGLASEPDLVTITLAPNLPPVANDISVLLDMFGDPTSVTLIGNDPDGNNANLTYEIVTLPPSPPFRGNLNVGVGPIAGNIVEYQSNSASFPDPDSFTYRVIDELGAVSNIATVNLKNSNTRPIANNLVVFVNQGAEISIPEVFSDIPGSGVGGSDPDGDALTVVDVNTPLRGILDITNLSGVNTYTYTPDPTTTSFDRFNYRVSDGIDESFSREVFINVNGRPIADAGNSQTVAIGDQVLLNGTGFDDEDGINVSYQWTSPAGILLDDETLENPTFTVPAGVDTSQPLLFSLIVSDMNPTEDPNNSSNPFGPSGPFASESATVEITVNPVPGSNNKPTAQSFETMIIPNRFSSVRRFNPLELLGSDVDSGETDTLTYEIISAPTRGDLDYFRLTIDGRLIRYNANNWSLPADIGSNDQFTYRVTDINGAVSNIATVTLVPPLVNEPVADAGTDEVIASGEENIDFGEGYDIDGSIQAYTWRQISGETVNITATGTDGRRIEYTVPTVTKSETKELIFGLTVTDNDGFTSLEDEKTVTVVFGCYFIANAGLDRQEISGNNPVSLYGSAETAGRCPVEIDLSPDGYTWTQVDASGNTLPDSDPNYVGSIANGSISSFDAPTVNSGIISLFFKVQALTADVVAPSSEADIVQIDIVPVGTTIPNQRPIASTPDPILEVSRLGRTRRINFFATDPDGDPQALTYRIFDKPISETVGALSDIQQQAFFGEPPSFSVVYTPTYPVSEETYTFSFVAIDNYGAESDPFEVTLRPADIPVGNQPPVISNLNFSIKNSELNWNGTRTNVTYGLQVNQIVSDPESEFFEGRLIDQNSTSLTFTLFNFGSGGTRVQIENPSGSDISSGTFTYFLVDTHGAESNIGTFTVTGD